MEMGRTGIVLRNLAVQGGVEQSFESVSHTHTYTHTHTSIDNTDIVRFRNSASWNLFMLLVY
jgi:hypothetical protein